MSAEDGSNTVHPFPSAPAEPVVPEADQAEVEALVEDIGRKAKSESHRYGGTWKVFGQSGNPSFSIGAGISHNIRRDAKRER